MKKEFKEGTEAIIHLDSRRATIKKITNWQTPNHNDVDGFWLKKNHMDQRHAGSTNV